MNKLNEAQVERLIDLVREKPALFNTADKCHKNFALKEMIWKDISENLGADEKDCKTAWKSLRDQFVKASREDKNRTGQEHTAKKTYKYYNKLLFLRHSLKSTRATPSNGFSAAEPEIMVFNDPVASMLNSFSTAAPNAVPPPGDNDAFFASLANMVNQAQLTPGETRHIQRNILNFVVDQLNNIERYK